MQGLTDLQRDLLVVIGGLETPSGLDIKGEIEQSQDRTILSGRVYDNLNDLVSRDLVEKGTIDGRTNSYSLTTSGMETVRAHYRWQRSYLPADDVLPADRSEESESGRFVPGSVG